MLLGTVRLAPLYFFMCKRAQGDTQPFTPYENANDKSHRLTHWSHFGCMRDDRNALFMQGLSKGFYYSEISWGQSRISRQRHEAVSRVTHLFPELSVNTSIVEVVFNIACLHPAESHMLVYTLKLTQTHQQKERERKRVNFHRRMCIAINFLFKVILKLFLSISNIRHKAKNKFWKF